MARLASVEAMARRQFTPGSMILLLIAFWVFAPRVWDTIIGEPWISSEMRVVINSASGATVEDLTLTSARVYGSRTVYVEDASGEVLCSTEHFNTWMGERKRFWRFKAFTDCEVPNEVFRICSGFSLTSEVSGRHRRLGPFCTPLTELWPEEEPPT